MKKLKQLAKKLLKLNDNFITIECIIKDENNIYVFSQVQENNIYNEFLKLQNENVINKLPLLLFYVIDKKSLEIGCKFLDRCVKYNHNLIKLCTNGEFIITFVLEHNLKNVNHLSIKKIIAI